VTTVRVSACIVGGGPAGLMLGLLLAKRGAGVLVLEGHENFDREFRGEVLQPSTAHLLDELGLLEYVKAQPHSLLEAGKIRLAGHEIGEFSFKRIAPQYPYAIWMPQPIFLAALLRKAQPLPSFQCWMGAKVTKLIEEDGRVVGVQVARLPEGSLLTDAGLRAGDVITRINGTEIDGMATLVGLWPRLQTASELRAVVVRNGRPVSLVVSLR